MEHDIIIIDSCGHFSNYHNYINLAQQIMSARGRQQLASAMAAPIHRNLNYAGFASRVFNVQQLPTPPVSAYYVQGINAAEILTDIFDEPQVVATEKLATAANILRSSTDSFTHDVILINSSGSMGQRNQIGYSGSIYNRSVQRAREEIMAQEDANIFKLKWKELCQ